MAFVPAPGYQPAYNPTLPYHRPIPGSLSVGMSIYIQGVASEHMKRFFVNFEVGQGPEADIAFHFNPRFDGWDKVVLNTRQNGNWGNEEKKRSMPFSKGAAFELVFMVLADHYKVVVNGNPFYEFGHRIPLQMVTHLHVDGDLQLQSINFIGGQPAPNQVHGEQLAKTQALEPHSNTTWRSPNFRNLACPSAEGSTLPNLCPCLIRCTQVRGSTTKSQVTSQPWRDPQPSTRLCHLMGDCKGGLQPEEPLLSRATYPPQPRALSSTSRWDPQGTWLCTLTPG
ncbi:galectin-4 isoform X3 [Balaenoptera ricei]|uniref:galectin-4 isoform X3 n=1 Tax=Balaenoptera ricei TaxID=2746895 RepID=UPI0028BE46DA|nr:galectin-4 isoform X3 [Balaenoptera ricei]